MHYIFCHGFGFSPRFFQRLVPYFAQERCSMVDLGYFGDASIWPVLDDEPVVCIGHSLGFAKLCLSYGSIPQACGFIGLNGFVDFLGREAALYRQRAAELAAMADQFSRAPALVLRKFYRRCGAANFQDEVDLSALNYKALTADFALLGHLRFIPPKRHCLLYSRDDLIVSDNLLHEQQKLGTNCLVVEGAHGHALGWVACETIYFKIKAFVDDICI
ncbi:alpha/beta fold hydrolase [Bartonella sp. DGB2]|uniref:alpha/beta fold hydrolase n=1 Tax=Bartonella sp. DGB2 TaxID=3388426 RepID=UPI00399005AC